MKPSHENNGASSYIGTTATISQQSPPFNPTVQGRLWVKGRRQLTFQTTQPAQSCFNVHTTVGTFLLVSCSNTFQNLLWFVHGQGQNC